MLFSSDSHPVFRFTSWFIMVWKYLVYYAQHHSNLTQRPTHLYLSLNFAFLILLLPASIFLELSCSKMIAYYSQKRTYPLILLCLRNYLARYLHSFQQYVDYLRCNFLFRLFDPIRYRVKCLEVLIWSDSIVCITWGFVGGFR